MHPMILDDSYFFTVKYHHRIPPEYEYEYTYREEISIAGGIDHTQNSHASEMQGNFHRHTLTFHIEAQHVVAP